VSTPHLFDVTEKVTVTAATGRTVDTQTRTTKTNSGYLQFNSIQRQKLDQKLISHPQQAGSKCRAYGGDGQTIRAPKLLTSRKK
jgi:hypothetical protein